jgi:nucleotide-binding universal stress UspA family protein
MLPFRRILFPVDFSDACKAVVPYVNDMRKRYDVELTLVHAFVPAPLIVGEFGSVSGAGYPGYEPLRKAEKARLEEFAREMFPGIPVQLIMEDGEPGAVITDVVKRHGTDLVMVPTRGHGAFRRLLLGSTAAKLLHDVSCAVWTGVHRQTPDYDAHLPYRKPKTS